GPLSSARRAGGGRPVARSLLRRAETNSRALQGAVLLLRRRRRGAPLQSAAHRPRLAQGTLFAVCAPLAPRSGERVARALSAFTRVFDALWRGPGEGQPLATRMLSQLGPRKCPLAPPPS